MTSAYDTPDTSDTDQKDAENLLAGLRDGAWLDAQEFPPLQYAVDGLLPEGFSLLIGPPKAGKSWLALGLLLAIAGGRPAVGRIAMSTKRRVLYLALEDGDRRMQDRCRNLLNGEPIPPLFHYLTQVQPGRVVATIEAFLEQHPDTALIVVDTLGKVMPPSQPGESAYQRDYRVAGRLKVIADMRPGLAVSVLHHDRKAIADDFVDAVSGTHGLAGAADTIIVLARKRQSSEAVLKVTGRDVPEAEYALTMTNGEWVLDGANLAEAAQTAQHREETADRSDRTIDIATFVRQHPAGVQAKKVAERFGPDAYKYLTRLTDDGLISKFKRGLYGPVSEVSEESETEEAA
ncbi:AAA family ATPase [Amycolatopsis thermophila]|uniref:RecA-family ATPase n=1 Tax=Amycolatopsis thermophila TaxID=206084 RepID=A0ABU0F4H3_9PSEU|nr:AAA family ATPase [Amycolatopsis thermophila]MDQ0382436.1 RecA-family ATPase [Amycolatopsis thermophila]